MKGLDIIHELSVTIIVLIRSPTRIMTCFLEIPTDRSELVMGILRESGPLLIRQQLDLSIHLAVSAAGNTTGVVLRSQDHHGDPQTPGETKFNGMINREVAVVTGFPGQNRHIFWWDPPTVGGAMETPQ